MNICVFQGTFNPIHNAHLRMARFVTDKYNFDKFIFIPAYKPPHKNYDINMSYHRLNMVELAIKNENPKIEVSDIEFKRNDKSYTYVTICELYKKYDINNKINFVIGTDAFNDIENWYETNKLKNLIKFLVFKRSEEINTTDFDRLKKAGYDFELQNLDFEDISSTELRNKIRNKENISKYVCKEVEEYISANKLYED